MPRGNILVFGGTGYFGRLLIQDLLRYSDCSVVAASRHQRHSDLCQTIVADLDDAQSLAPILTGVDIAICAAGPFQRLSTHLCELCIDRGIHYIDLADDRNFARQIRALAASRKCESAICTAWSTVSALSGALVRIATRDTAAVKSIYIHMAPGNRGARQSGTITSLMHSVGRPITIWRDGASVIVSGWSEPRDYQFPSPVGVRTGYLVDAPDHELFPELFLADTVEFRTSSELSLQNDILSFLSRRRRNYVSWSPFIQRGAALLSWIGHDCGAVGVEVQGSSPCRVTVVAQTHAPRLAVLPAAVTAMSLLSQPGLYRGLISHADWITTEQLNEECHKRGFTLAVEKI
jgi:saccharopine dehydrogenase-like protein